jgi:hypothetical protein
MPALAEVHLVSDADDPGEAFARPMIALPDHAAYLREAGEARRLRSAKRMALEMRDDELEQIAD